MAAINSIIILYLFLVPFNEMIHISSRPKIPKIWPKLVLKASKNIFKILEAWKQSRWRGINLIQLKIVAFV